MAMTPAQTSYMRKLAQQQTAQQEAANAHGQTVGTAYELPLASAYSAISRARA